MFLSKKQKDDFCNLMALDYRVSFDQAKEIYNLTKDKQLTEQLCSKINTLNDYNETVDKIMRGDIV